jgi:hypothetical protein
MYEHLAAHHAAKWRLIVPKNGCFSWLSVVIVQLMTVFQGFFRFFRVFYRFMKAPNAVRLFRDLTPSFYGVRDPRAHTSLLPRPADYQVIDTALLSFSAVVHDLASSSAFFWRYAASAR